VGVAQFRHEFFYCASAGLAHNITNEKQFHSAPTVK
jgi:hypothetical protein